MAIILNMDIIQQLIKENTDYSSLPEKLYDRLLRDILMGRYGGSGSKLSENAVCSDYGVSRTPVRETFRRLETEGVLEYIPNRGEFIRGFSDEEIDDMIDIVSSLSVMAVRRAVERITEDEEEELADLFKHMEFYTKKGDVQKMIHINLAFHRLIRKASHDEPLCRTLDTFGTYLRYLCPPNYFEKNYLTRVLEEHRKIYQALQRKDAGAAVRAMQACMDNSARRAGRGPSHLIV
ncbi:MAG: GntR family transcriptional regulator [Firmicutes bacterium]|nr:GntR family transcriptional regulator [Bacillota bacterium]MBR3053946.1 GntR family transcriptional regulator [Bacillota bacterium]